MYNKHSSIPYKIRIVNFYVMVSLNLFLLNIFYIFTHKARLTAHRMNGEIHTK